MINRDQNTGSGGRVRLLEINWESQEPTLKIIQPDWLFIVLGCLYSSIQEHKYYDEPIERLRLYRFTAGPSHPSIYSANQ